MINKNTLSPSFCWLRKVLTFASMCGSVSGIYDLLLFCGLSVFSGVGGGGGGGADFGETESLFITSALTLSCIRMSKVCIFVASFCVCSKLSVISFTANSYKSFVLFSIFDDCARRDK